MDSLRFLKCGTVTPFCNISKPMDESTTMFTSGQDIPKQQRFRADVKITACLQETKLLSYIPL